MPRRRFWSLNQVADYLDVSRERVLLLELGEGIDESEPDFPEHITDEQDRIFWDADELDEWAEDIGWFEEE